MSDLDSAAALSENFEVPLSSCSELILTLWGIELLISEKTVDHSKR